ncbi:MAG: SET domain-containing protein [Candidatus Kapaibacteriota bacterium]
MSSHSIPVTAQCAYVGSRGRCTRHTTVTHPYCGPHTKQVLGVSVRKSLIPGAGKGLFAETTFHKGENIVQYTGEHISVAAFDKRYGTDSLGAYGITLNDTTVIDAAATTSGVARYACDYHGSGKKPNAQYESDDREVWIVALRTIKPGEEIYTDYGTEMHQALGLE